MTLDRNSGGPKAFARNADFLTASHIPGLLKNRADALQISRSDYFSTRAKMSASRIFRAFAILRQVSRVGIRLWLSMKLIPARLMPVFWASTSCDRPRALRAFFSSSTTFSTAMSDDLSLMGKSLPTCQKFNT